MARGEPVVREDLKRFRKEYAQPVQLRYVMELKISAQKSLEVNFFSFEQTHVSLHKLSWGGSLITIIRKLYFISISKKRFPLLPRVNKVFLKFYLRKFVFRFF